MSTPGNPSSSGQGQLVSYFNAVPLIASSLTYIHVGAGRSPGAVDLPVIRDPFNIPFIPGSSFKGALKSTLVLAQNCTINRRGFVDCNSCSELCCLLGPEPGGGDEGASAVSILDLTPIAIPVPSLEKGYIYASSLNLALRAKAVLETVAAPGGSVFQCLESLLGLIEQLGRELSSGQAASATGATGEVTVGLDRYTLKQPSASSGQGRVNTGTVANNCSGVLRVLNPLYSPVKSFLDRLYVFSDEDISQIIEKGVHRMARVAIRRDTKTVSRGALWTEEYLPPGTLFASAVLYTEPRATNYCSTTGIQSRTDVWNRFTGMMSSIARRTGNGGTYYVLVIGGKETVGKGILRFLLG